MADHTPPPCSIRDVVANGPCNGDLGLSSLSLQRNGPWPVNKHISVIQLRERERERVQVEVENELHC